MATNPSPRAAGAQPWTPREHLIAQMLRSWDLLEPAGMSGVGSTTGERVPMLGHEQHCLLVQKASPGWVKGQKTTPARCTCWVRGMTELSRCLRKLRQEDRPLWYAVHERFCACERKPMLVHVKHGHPQIPANVELVGLVDRAALNRRGDGVVRVLVETWCSRVDLARAHSGVVWLAAEFRGSPQMPVDLMEAA